jgi:Ca2+-binding EF-hand superfamily protein
MGNGPSGAVPVLSEHTALIMAQYNLRPRHLRKLASLFDEMDENKTGKWTIIEYSNLINVSSGNIVTPCLEALVKFGSATRDGRLGFEDFLVTTSSYCALSKEELLQFVYLIIDADRSGVLDKEELENFYSASIFVPRKHHSRQAVYPENYMTALSEFGGGTWKSLVYEEFCLMCDLFPHLAFPAVHLQMLLRREILGTRFWKLWDRERLKIFHLEAESKTITFNAPSLITGEIVNVVKPGRITMKEIFEYTKRKGLRRGSIGSLDREQFGDGGDDSFTKSRDAVLKRAPLLNLIRNPNSLYHVPLSIRTGSGLQDVGMVESRLNRETGGFLGALDKANETYVT